VLLTSLSAVAGQKYSFYWHCYRLSKNCRPKWFQLHNSWKLQISKSSSWNDR